MGHLASNGKYRSVLVHVNGLERVTPLAGGYLKAYAMADADLAAKWDIELYNAYIESTSASKLIHDIHEMEADVIGFSIYVWNAGLVRRILPILRDLLPRASFVLGGTDAIDRIAAFVPAAWENVFVCNGEGEKTFHGLLRTLSNEGSSFDEVGGLSFFRNGELRVTKPCARIKSLDEVPSPYLKGYFDRRDYSVALLETNRGCPYDCSFCFWGGAVGQKVHRMGMQRLSAEIEWLGNNKARSILVCDANFGIFPEDLVLARKLVRTKEETGYPRKVHYTSAKNNPGRALEIAKVFTQGKLLSMAPLSLQSLNKRALSLSGRDTIHQEDYRLRQKEINELGIPSFIELIWPLPGETLSSFKQGLDDLCRMDAQAFSVYPHIWLNNTSFSGMEKEYGVVTLDSGDANSSAKTVIQTTEVSFRDWIDGLLYTNAVQLLHGCRGLYHTCFLLEGLGIAGRRDIYEKFRATMDSAHGTEFARAWQLGRDNVDEVYSLLSWPGHLVEQALHYRTEFDETLRQFVHENDAVFGGRELIAAAIDFDILTRPYVYRNTPLGAANNLSVLRVLESNTRGWLVESPYDIPREVLRMKLGEKGEVSKRPTLLLIDHDRGQVYRHPRRKQKEWWDECRLFMQEMGNHYPTWTAITSESNEFRVDARPLA